MAIIAGVTFGIAFSQVKDGANLIKAVWVSFYDLFDIIQCDCKLVMMNNGIIELYFLLSSADWYVAGLLSVQDHHSQSV